MKQFITLFLSVLLFISCADLDKTQLQKLEGNALGTTFHISYQDNQKRDFSKQIDSLLHRINKSLSTYIPTSDISRINQGDTSVVVDAYFEEVFNKSAVIYKATDGIFDPTIGTLVNAWGFGPQKTMTSLDKNQIDSLLQYVGFNKVQLVNHHVIKADKNMYLDFNAIAKGYAIDILGRYFESQNISKYLVEMGGEIRARGDKEWRIAIEHPNFDGSQSFQATVTLLNESIATSGSYRKFKLDKTGRKYIHIINPKTGYAAMSNLLSASVIAPVDCADVDGYATAFIAMGLEKTKAFLKTHKSFKVFLIYSDVNGEIKTYKTENLELKK
ncbi:MAG: FAD:protein FMN transferase [Flavobacteriaceae bacterium]